MRVIEIDEIIYEINDKDYAFVKEQCENYLLRTVDKAELKKIISRITSHNRPVQAELSIKTIYEGEFGIKFND